jgi:hypothetical protein
MPMTSAVVPPAGSSVPSNTPPSTTQHPKPRHPEPKLHDEPHNDPAVPAPPPKTADSATPPPPPPKTAEPDVPPPPSSQGPFIVRKKEP